MRDIDDIDNIFRIMDEMFSKNFSGGYRKSDYTDTTGHVDIQEDEDNIYITLELKVQEEDIEVSVEEDLIHLEVMQDGSWRKKTIRLPTLVNPKSLKTTFNNCVLDITLSKVKEKEDE